ncbi:MAG: sulfotransferase domain-containing protein [Nitrosopumilus sp.]|nr:sulfotransferase domain-containing protein [Nitrosopumilus sp.]MDH3488188.1 sulfotransferase domain-containing protein [Nitrosopumilus sp.]
MNSLPDFIIIGAQRCGTTSLYNYLIEHPKIKPASQKELHFFDINFSKGIEWYKSQFEDNYITTEASPYYLFHPHCPQRIFDILPYVKIIILFRNPIDRAYSHYWHEIRLGAETLSFEKAIEEEPSRLKGEVDKIMNDEKYYSYNHQHFSYLSRGKYFEQVKNWYNFFKKSQILILNSEEFYSNPQKTMNLVYDFLDIPKSNSKKFKVFNEGHNPIMKKDTRKYLSDYFREYNEQLYDYIERKFVWK